MQKKLWITSIILALITIAFSELDIVISKLFYMPSAGFYMRDEDWSIFIKEKMYLIDSCVLTMIVGFWIGGKINKESCFAIKNRSLLFLFSSYAVVMSVGGIMKELWKRPRPRHLEVFGGTEDFFAPFVITTGFGTNGGHSFPSCHTLAAVWLLAVALLLPKPIRKIGIFAVICFTLVVIFARVSGGHHFLSDTIFSCLIAVPIIVAMKEKICKEN